MQRGAAALAAWNVGAADLVLAIAFGITSSEGSPLQLFAGPGSEAMQHAPWSFVPTVLVPIWLILRAMAPGWLRGSSESPSRTMPSPTICIGLGSRAGF
jgi:hypothetical protein